MALRGSASAVAIEHCLAECAMGIGTPEAQTQVAPMARGKAPEADIGAPTPTSETGKQPSQPAKKRMPASTRLPSIIVGVVTAAMAGGAWFGRLSWSWRGHEAALLVGASK